LIKRQGELAMSHKSEFIAALIVLFMFTSISFATGNEISSAVEGALSWLELIDNGHYRDSWDASSSLFKGAVTKDQWDQTLKGVRSPLGRPLSRKRISARYETSLPGAPDGEYVVIQFESSFENKRNAVETVTPMRDSDGAWRVSGYYIK